MSHGTQKTIRSGCVMPTHRTEKDTILGYTILPATFFLASVTVLGILFKGPQRAHPFDIDLQVGGA